MTLQQILEEVKNGQLSVEHAENLLKKEGYEEMDYAKSSAWSCSSAAAGELR